jgi:protocatechuate 3,4-dioxygenase beta subunit
MKMRISRREFAIGAAGAALSSGLTATAARAQAPLRPTGQETLGPFYPVRTPASNDPDLTHYPGRQGRAAGQVIELTGRVLDTAGRPLPRAALTIWQANAAGRYTNPVDRNPAPLDPNFLGVTHFQAGRDGSYRLRTVKPGAYPEPSGTLRTPHIHFDVTNADYRLVTQMYFPGESLNATDLLLSTLAARHRDPRAAICNEATASEPGVLAFTWDIVLLT